MQPILTRTTLLATLLVASHLSFGQAPRALPQYSINVRSDAWMDSVRRLPLPQQVAAVRARVLADTVLRHPHPALCFMALTAAQREAYDRAQAPERRAEAARLVGPLPLYAGDGYELRTNYQAPTLAFVRELDSRTIQRVEFIKSTDLATVLYGTSGASGVIRLTTRQPQGR